MSWILIAVIAYFFLAIVNLLDKFLLDNVLNSSKVYTFLITVMGASVVIIAPWFLHWPGTFLLFFQLATGLFFPLALLFMFEALKRGDASKVTVLIGGIIPVLTILFSVLFFQEKFLLNQRLGLLFLLLGTFAIALIGEKKTIKQKLFNRQVIVYSFLAALFYAIFFIGTKYSYDHHDFLSSFIWVRLGSLITIIFLLIRKKDRQEIFGSFKKRSRKIRTKAQNFIIFGTQILGALAFILQNYAISFGSVAIVNALQGVQYAFLLAFSWILGLFLPKLFREDFSVRIILEKVLAIILVSIGLYFIVI
ncbi:MAG: EamA family transporter [Patescibacteria group bacterium]|jgi:drug/metabolite transporter (DMT)-like permease